MHLSDIERYLIETLDIAESDELSTADRLQAALDGLNVVLGLVRRERGIARLSARCGAVPCGHEAIN